MARLLASTARVRAVWQQARPFNTDRIGGSFAPWTFASKWGVVKRVMVSGCPTWQCGNRVRDSIDFF